MPMTIVTQGTFTATGNPVNINLPQGLDYFKTFNLTQAATTATPGCGIMFEYWPATMANNSAIQWSKSNGSNAMNVTQITTGGFTYYPSYPNPEAPVTITAITNANPAVVTATNTYNNGDRVVIYGTTGMLQISGMVFTVSSVSGSNFTLLGLDASGFTNAATAGFARRLPASARVEPRTLYITKISKATQAVVTVSEAHSYVVGQKVELTVPGSFGMVEMNNFNQAQSNPATITAVGTYTITLNVNSSNYTTFAFPASSSSPTAQLFATIAPAGQSTQFNQVTNVQTGYNFTYVPFHTGLFIPYINLQAGANSPAGQVIASVGDTIMWQAYKMETGTFGV